MKMAEAIESRLEEILESNRQDLKNADAKGIQGAMRDRLKLNEARVKGMAQSLREVAELPDPVGEIINPRLRPNGLKVAQMRMPLGVIGIIYEARPNVTADAAGLCLKSGNVSFLRGGSEAQHSNAAILEILRDALESCGLSRDVLMSLPSTDRTWILEMLKAEPWLDVIIPRGGEALIRFVTEHSRIPVIKHYKGVCHIFVDESADPTRALEICHNAKMQRPGVCNAMETLLVHQKVAAEFLPRLEAHLTGVELRGCAETLKHLPEIQMATEEDWSQEYLDLILSVRVVGGLSDAIEHIHRYGSDHTESILSENEAHQQRFLAEVQSSVVMVNASTRFSDGGEMGLGAEIGISTTRLHAYGPMGVEDLTCRKYIIQGTGQIRS